jgi:Ser-tRNA(Ala) deacylase AlaX
MAVPISSGLSSGMYWIPLTVVSVRLGQVRMSSRMGPRIKKFVRTARRYRTMQIRAGQQILTAADPLPENLRDALAKTTSPDSAH